MKYRSFATSLLSLFNSKQTFPVLRSYSTSAYTKSAFNLHQPASLSTSSFFALKAQEAVMTFGQFAATTQFYLYGKKYCTATGYENAVKNDYKEPDILSDPSLDLSEKVYIITGANGGIGREMTSFFAKKNATVYMVCRSADRAAQAQAEVMAECQHSRVYTLIGDCGLEVDVRRVWEQFVQHRQQQQQQQQQQAGKVAGGSGSESSSSDNTVPRLDALVCNAGALLNEKTLSKEGIEVTFATHLLFGVYLLGSLAMPVLQNTAESKLILVSSGGMYNTKFPRWDTATSTGPGKYDGQLAYAYAKRGQVLLAERWAEMIEKQQQQRSNDGGVGGAVSGPKVVSCHPGWTLTAGVDSAYGEQKKYLEPLRTLWQGAEAICWLCVAPNKEIEGGAFYLDRTPRRKHIAGPFFTEGTFTKNTREQTDQMMQNLEMWSNIKGNTRPSAATIAHRAAIRLPVEATTKPLNIQSYMGTWYVLANIPTYLETGATDCYERYLWDEKENKIKVAFEYTSEGAAVASKMQMSCTVHNGPNVNTHWKLNPEVLGIGLPLGLDYCVVDHDADIATDTPASWCIIGMTDRSYLWIMTRARPVPLAKCAPSAKEMYQLPVPPINDLYPEPSEATKAAVEAVRDSVIFAAQEGASAPPVLTAEQEKAIMETAFQVSHNLGFDCNKIQRVGWSNP